MEIKNKDGYSTIQIQTEVLRELRDFVKENVAQLGKYTTYNTDALDDFLIESMKALG